MAGCQAGRAGCYAEENEPDRAADKQVGVDRRSCTCMLRCRQAGEPAFQTGTPPGA